MDSLRQNKINELIKRELSEILIKNFDFPLDCLVTILDVETSSDLSKSKIFFSIFPLEQSLSVFNLLKKDIGTLQKALNRRLKMKVVPHLKLYLKQ
ncbi:ribosome-binding factor A [Patescibacteria group bacterium]|nr:ribosome-binding factor A [Patescibacteria group bacterium]